MSKIIEFQSTSGLRPDGVIGPLTLKKMQSAFDIQKKEHMAHFIGQCAHESGQFKIGRENLNYTEKRLLQIFPKYFTTITPHPSKKLASQYAKKPQAIGNWVYANRMGNGNEASGDGWKNRGAGPLQLTGRFNIEAFSIFIGDPCVVENPDLIVTKYYFESALFFFSANKIWKHCDLVNPVTILSVSRAINLGNPYSKVMPHHMKERTAETEKYYKLLA